MQTATERVAAFFDGWAPSLRALIADSDEMPIIRPIHALPASLTWQRVPGSCAGRLRGSAIRAQPSDRTHQRQQSRALFRSGRTDERGRPIREAMNKWPVLEGAYELAITDFGSRKGS